MSDVEVSWVIPVRNGGPWLADAVRSVIADAGPQDEILVIDDGSEPPVLADLHADSRVRIVRQSPLGLVAALEAGRRAASGEFIARVDADDLVIPDRRNAQLEYMRAHPRCAVLGGRARFLAATAGADEGMRLYVDWVNSLADLHRELLVESPLIHPSVMVRRSVIDAVGGYRSGDFPEDYDLWLRVVLAGHRIERLDRDVVVWRDRPDRLTRTDPRYRPEAFASLKREYLEKTILDRPRRTALWCGRKSGRSWLRWLRDGGHEVVVVDIVSAHARQGCEVIAPERLIDRAFDILLVTVGSRGAREEIRAFIGTHLPHLEEGRDWFALR